MAMKPEILVAFDIHEDGLEILKGVGEKTDYPTLAVLPALDSVVSTYL